MRKNIAVVFIAALFISACSQQGAEQTKAENEAMSAKIRQLEQENARLKAGETNEPAPVYTRNRNTLEANPRFEATPKKENYIPSEDREIVDAASKFRAIKVKYTAMEYDLKYKTVSSELNTKANALQSYAQQEYLPAAQNFSNLLVTYSNTNGGTALRDLAVKYEFLDLLR